MLYRYSVTSTEIFCYDGQSLDQDDALGGHKGVWEMHNVFEKGNHWKVHEMKNQVITVQDG